MLDVPMTACTTPHKILIYRSFVNGRISQHATQTDTNTPAIRSCMTAKHS